MILVSNQIKQVVALLQDRLPKLDAVYLYGSGATADFNDESDVDLAFVTTARVSTVDSWNLSGELASMLRRDVDLVNLNETDTVHQLQIIEHGVPIFISDDFKKDWYELKIIQAYLTLNDDRKEILAAIYERGSVYG